MGKGETDGLGKNYTEKEREGGREIVQGQLDGLGLCILLRVPPGRPPIYNRSDKIIVKKIAPDQPVDPVGSRARTIPPRRHLS